MKKTPQYVICESWDRLLAETLLSRHGGIRSKRLGRGQARVPGAVDRRRLRGVPWRLGSRRRLRRRLDQDHRTQGWRRLRHQRRQNVDHQRHASRLICAFTNTSDGAAHKNKSLICLPMKTKGVEMARKLDKLGMRSSDTAQIFFDNVRVPQRFLIGEEGKGFIYQMLQFQEERRRAAAANLKSMERLIEQTIEYTRNRKGLRQVDPRQSGGAFPAGRAFHRGRAVARAHLSRLRTLPRRYRCDAACLHGQAQRRTAAPRVVGCLSAILGRHGLHERDAGEPGVSRWAPGSIGGGADEIMLTIICKLMETLPGTSNAPELNASGHG